MAKYIPGFGRDPVVDAGAGPVAIHTGRSVWIRG